MSAHANICTTAQRLHKAFVDNAHSTFANRGFMLDDQGYVHLIVAHTKDTSQSVYNSQPTTTLQTLTLHEIQKISQYFYKQMGSSEGAIFSPAPSAISHQNTLGYLCYQMTRRLQRLEHDHFPEKKKIDYAQPFDETRMADIIRTRLSNKIGTDGFLTRPEFSDIRAAEIPAAMEHEHKKLSKLAPYPAHLMLDLV